MEWFEELLAAFGGPAALVIIGLLAYVRQLLKERDEAKANEREANDKVLELAVNQVEALNDLTNAINSWSRRDNPK